MKKDAEPEEMDTHTKISRKICEHFDSALRRNADTEKKTISKWSKRIAQCQGDVVVALDRLRVHEGDLKERFVVLIEKALYETDKRATAKEFARDVINYVVGLAKEILRTHNEEVGQHTCNSMAEISSRTKSVAKDIQESVCDAVKTECKQLIERGWKRVYSVRGSCSEEIRTSRDTAERRLKQLQTSHAEEVREKTDKLRRDFDDRIRALKDNLETQLKQRSAELKGVALELDTVKRSKEKLQTESELARQRLLDTIDKRDRMIKSLRSENATLYEQISTLKEQIASTGRDLQEVEGRWGGIAKRIEEMDAEIAVRDKKIKSMRRDVQSAREEAESLRSSAHTARRELADLQKSSASTRKERDKLAKQVKKQRRKIASIEEHSASSRRELEKAQSKLANTSDELAIVKTKLEVTNAEKFRAENENRVSKERVATLQLKLFRSYHQSDGGRKTGSGKKNMFPKRGGTVKRAKASKGGGGIFGVTKMLKQKQQATRDNDDVDNDDDDDDKKRSRAPVVATKTVASLASAVPAIVQPSKVATDVADDGRFKKMEEKVRSLESKLVSTTKNAERAKEEHELMSREKDLLLSQLTILLRQYKARLEEMSASASNSATAACTETADSGSPTKVSKKNRLNSMSPIRTQRRRVPETLSSPVKKIDGELTSKGGTRAAASRGGGIVIGPMGIMELRKGGS